MTIIVSEYFPKGHINQGEPTGFPEKILAGTKKTTIRDSINWFKHNGKEIEIRKWSGKPYNSSQISIAKKKVEVKRIKIEFDKGRAFIDGRLKPIEEVANNDGLTIDQFRSWFKADKNPVFEGSIIYFSMKSVEHYIALSCDMRRLRLNNKYNKEGMFYAPSELYFGQKIKLS